MNDYYHFDNKVFVVIKPNFEGLSPKIIKMFMDEGFLLCKSRPKLLTRLEAQKLYRTHQKEDLFNNLVKYMSSGVSTGLLFQHRYDTKTAFEKVQKIKDKVREKYSESDMRNVIHSSDNIENMEREARIYF
jgi:nucleoside-diphosphate kinase